MSDYSSEYYSSDYEDDEEVSKPSAPANNSGFKFIGDDNSLGNDIRKKIQAKLNAKRDDNSGALISDIHPEIVTKYNSVNVIVGKQSLGKTVIALEEIIKIGYLNTHHMLIYVTKDGEENDRSWNTLKSLIELPILLVSEDNAEACINELIQAKSLYYRVRRERTKNILNKSQKADLFDTLQVENFEKSFYIQLYYSMIYQIQNYSHLRSHSLVNYYVDADIII